MSGSNLAPLECPYELPTAEDAFYVFRLDETLNTLWSLGAGDSVSLAKIAQHIHLTDAKALTWMQNNGKNYWESEEDGQRWKPLIGKHRNY